MLQHHGHQEARESVHDEDHHEPVRDHEAQNPFTTKKSKGLFTRHILRPDADTNDIFRILFREPQLPAVVCDCSPLPLSPLWTLPNDVSNDGPCLFFRLVQMTKFY